MQPYFLESAGVSGQQKLLAQHANLRYSATKEEENRRTQTIWEQAGATDCSGSGIKTKQISQKYLWKIGFSSEKEVSHRELKTDSEIPILLIRGLNSRAGIHFNGKKLRLCQTEPHFSSHWDICEERDPRDASYRPIRHQHSGDTSILIARLQSELKQWLCFNILKFMAKIKTGFKPESWRVGGNEILKNIGKHTNFGPDIDQQCLLSYTTWFVIKKYVKVTKNAGQPCVLNTIKVRMVEWPCSNRHRSSAATEGSRRQQENCVDTQKFNFSNHPIDWLETTSDWGQLVDKTWKSRINMIFRMHPKSE